MKINIISTSFLTHHISLKLHIFVWLILGLEKVLVLCEIVVFLIWNHINAIFLEDQECGLQLLPKITYEHVYLTPYSVMNVRLAAQVLSTTVSKVLSNYGPADAAGTAEF